MNIVPHLIAWAVLATVVVFLAIYRRKIRTKSDELLHVLDSEAGMVGTQAFTTKKLDRIDRWGKILTAVVILYAVAIAGVYLYSMFQDATVKMG